MMVQPSDIPDCDVLELDCEGAEDTILSELEIKPRVILVETHGSHDTPPSRVKTLLSELSYEIKSIKIAAEDRRQLCEENDIYVVTALRKCRNGV
jgi:hypothetical protein